MAGRRVLSGGKSEWWENAYSLNNDIHVQYELQFKKDLVKPGNPIKIENERGVFKFRCIAHNIKLDVTWIDCMDSEGQFRSFPIDQFKLLVKPKRSRAKKPNV